MTAIVQQLQEKVKELQQVPAVAHVLRMNTRYATRLGNQFAGAITYFSLLAMVPILMFAFSACGFTLTVLRPDLRGFRRRSWYSCKALLRTCRPN